MRAACLLVAALVLGAADMHSGYDDASPPVRHMQDDDSENPGSLWVAQGETLWQQKTGASAKSCASCHGDVASMRGVATRYPRFDGKVVTLSEQVQQCRTERQRASPWPAESDEMLAVTALIGKQSRGLELRVEAAGPARAALAQGRTIFEQRMGQLDLSCADCHDGLAGHRLGGSVIPQGHPNGYPEYRLEWQTLGSLERRIHNCLTGMRAEPFPPGSSALDALQFYLGWRANGLTVETPAVRP